MASESAGQQFNDSSGKRIKPKSKSSHTRGVIPEALELHKMSDTHIPRDSGCFTGSPMTAAHADTLDSSTTFFGDDCMHLDWAVRPKTHIKYRTSTPLLDSGTHSHIDRPEGMESDDEVFHSSEDTEFCDSGVQSLFLESKDHGPDLCQYRFQEEITSDTDTSTASGEEFSTAEFALEFAADSPVSSPIDIPPRSHNSTPETDQSDDEDCVFREQLAASSSTPSSSHVVHRLTRRTTVGEMTSTAMTNRPHSDYSVRAGNAARDQFYSQSLEGSEGPLPDVVPYGLRRCRALSESAIYTTRYAQRVGESLRNISDEFSDRRLQRQRIQLNLIQEMQRSPTDENRQAHPIIHNRNRNNKGRGIISSLQQRFFSSSHE